MSKMRSSNPGTPSHKRKGGDDYLVSPLFVSDATYAGSSLEEKEFLRQVIGVCGTEIAEYRRILNTSSTSTGDINLGAIRAHLRTIEPMCAEHDPKGDLPCVRSVYANVLKMENNFLRSFSSGDTSLVYRVIEFVTKAIRSGVPDPPPGVKSRVILILSHDLVSSHTQFINNEPLQPGPSTKAWGERPERIIPFVYEEDRAKGNSGTLNRSPKGSSTGHEQLSPEPRVQKPKESPIRETAGSSPALPQPRHDEEDRLRDLLERIDEEFSIESGVGHTGLRLSPHGSVLNYSWAVHVGPDYGNKSENQDAVSIQERGGRLYFALADGVSQSFGTRLGARIAVREAVNLMTLWPNVDTDFNKRKKDLAQVVSGVNEKLTTTLNNFISVFERTTDVEERSRWTKRFLGAQSLPYATTIAFAKNTLAPLEKMKRNLPPVMSTTLIAGVIEPSVDHPEEYRLTIVAAGDGIILHVTPQSKELIPILDVTPGEMAIECYCGPGELARNAESNLFTYQEDVRLCQGQRLIIASDGLARGPKGERFTDIHRRWLCELDHEPLKAKAIVEDALTWATTQFVEGKQYFNDNLSLISVDVTQRGSK